MPIYFFAGKSFRENSVALVRSLIPPLLTQDRGTARLSHAHSHAKSEPMLLRPPDQANISIVAIIKGVECEGFYSDGGVSIAEPSTSAMEQVYQKNSLIFDVMPKA